MGIVTFSPIQEGTGDPSPTNVRPIKPGLVLKSKNLLNPDKIYDGFIWGDDTIGNDAQWHYTDYVEVTEETTYTVSGSIVTNTSPTAQFVFYNESKSKISSIHSGQSNFTFTTPSGTRYVRLSLKGDDPFQLELGSIATEYEPYYNMEIYGGHVDFNTGELVEEYQLIQFDGTEAIYKTASGDLRRYTLYLEDKTGIQLYGSRSLAKCSHCILVNGSTAGTYGTLRYTHSESRGYRATYIALNDAYDEQFGGSVDNVLEWFKTQADNGAPFQLLVGRVDSITHSLITSQLTQAYNQLVPVSPVMLNKRRRMLLDSPHLETVSGSIATFNTDMSTNIIDMKIHFYPVQEGSGDPSPDNVRPITGWDGVTVIKTGKNLANLNESEMLSYGWTKAFPNPFRKPGKHTISCQNTIVTGSQSGSFVFLGNAVTDSSGYVLTGWTFGKSVMSVSFNITAEALERKYIVFRFNAPTNYASLSNAQIQIEEGLEATEYEDPPLEIPISFGRTIYGGYVDLIKGEVAEEYGSVDLSTVGFSQYGKLNHCWSGAISDMVFGNQLDTGTLYCDSYKPDSKKSILSNGYNLRIWGYNTTQRCVIIRNDAYIDEDGVYDITAFKESLQGAMFYYPLATPNTYSLTPQTIKTLRGINNIWSSANGDIEVRFWVH